MGAAFVYRPFIRAHHHPEISTVTVASILHALSDPVRMAIVRELAKHGVAMNCSETVAKVLGGLREIKGEKKKKAMPKSTTSLHFRILREAGLIRSERVGVECDNSLRLAELDKRFPGLVRAILKADALERAGK